MDSLQTSAIALTQIKESPLNHRKYFGEAELQELAESVKAHGVLQPVLVRPLPGGSRNGRGNAYELVYGHRRFRAAKLAGLKSIPATVRELDDRAVLEIALIENCRRADVRPMEEADAYQELHLAHQVPVKEIAEKVGKSHEYVYARLKLAELESPEARAALDAGKLSASTALIIARIPIAELRKKATKEILEGGGVDIEEANENVPYGKLPHLPMSFRVAQRHVQDKYMLELKRAPFDTSDPDLLQVAPTCLTCPKRTGNCRELYPVSEVKSSDVCTDPVCFGEKKKAGVKQLKEEAKKEGKHHLGIAPGLFSPWGPGLSQKGAQKYVELSAKCNEDPQARTYAKLLGKTAPVVLALDEKGKEHKLLPRDELSSALAAAGHEIRIAEKASTRSAPDDRERDQALKTKVAKRALDLLVTTIESGTMEGLDVLRLVVNERAYDLGSIRGEGEGTAKAKIAGASEVQLLGMLVQLEYADDAEYVYSEYRERFVKVCHRFGVSLKALEKEEREKASAPAAEEKPKAKKKGRSP